MKYIKIKNQGEITAEALTLLGASTKRNDKTKIGYFGSGNKFAIAYLLRNNFEIKIFGGKNEIIISTIEKSIGKQKFDVITVNGKETSITTDFGVKWELWQAMRELYSNAKDEGNYGIELVNDIIPLDEETHIYIKMKPELSEWVSKFDNYFAENKTVLYENKYGRILSKHDETTHIYRKGISVFHNSNKSLYDYDLNDITITEDRIVKYSWQISEKIWRLLYTCEDKNIIKNVLTNSADNYEGMINEFSSVSASEISDEFKEVLNEMKFVAKTMTGWLTDDEKLNTTVLPTKVFKAVKHILNDENMIKKMQIGLNGEMYREIEFEPVWKATLNKVFDFLKEANYTEIYDNYDIIPATFDDKDIMGTIDKKQNTIIISNVCLEKGANYVLETLIEEYVHLKYDVSDETRSMQDALIREMVKIMKIKNAFVL